jgi:hypothetical protein
MGYLFKGACYPDLPSAKAADCSQSATFWGSTTNIYSSQCTSTTFDAASTTKTLCVQTNGGACTNRTVAYPNYPNCTYDGGVSLSSDYFAALLAFLAIIYVGSRLKQYFWGRHEGI